MDHHRDTENTEDAQRRNSMRRVVSRSDHHRDTEKRE